MSIRKHKKVVPVDDGRPREKVMVQAEVIEHPRETITVAVTLDIPPEIVDFVIEGITNNLPEASQGCVLRCVSWKYKQLKFKFEDGDNGKVYTIQKPELLKAFALMVQGDKWPAGCTRPPASNNREIWDQWLCQADGIDFDAFVQLACFGEVIYG